MIIPAMLYTISSILTHQIIQRVGSSSFQIWSNFRIIIQHVVSLFNTKTLTILQWVSILLLILGVVISTPAWP